LSRETCLLLRCGVPVFALLFFFELVVFRAVVLRAAVFRAAVLRTGVVLAPVFRRVAILRAVAPSGLRFCALVFFSGAGIPAGCCFARCGFARCGTYLIPDNTSIAAATVAKDAIPVIAC
jgi:hypothetical protein